MLNNRIVMPPMGTQMAQPDGSVSPAQLSYYEARARGGVGLLIVEATRVDSPLGPFSLRADEDRFIPGLAELTKRMHHWGAKAALQLCSRGVYKPSGITMGLSPADPSNPPAAPEKMKPEEISTDEISRISLRFAQAAGRAKVAGFDAVEIHAAHAYLLSQFLSPSINRRKDHYGGDIRGRARFCLEVVAAIRKEIGEEFPVLCRINGAEYGVNGVTTEDSQELAVLLEDAGVDAIDVSAFGYEHPVMWGSTPSVEGYLIALAENIKRMVSVPVITVGKIGSQLGEKVLQAGQADFIAVGRAHIADPDVVAKLVAGHYDDILPCIGCTECRDVVLAGRKISCTVNPSVGRENEFALVPASHKKRVMVVGGGPAGMTAARVAALRGHQVTLYEKAPQLGGQLLVADKPPFKGDISLLTQFLMAQLKKAGVKVKNGKEVTSATVMEANPDVVIIAVGPASFIPPIRGIERMSVVTATEVLAGIKVGKRVIVIGGESVGCETADFLTENGHQVTVTRRGSEMATKMNPAPRTILLKRLQEKGVRLITGVTYDVIERGALLITHSDGRKETLPVDTIVLATGARPNTELARQIGKDLSVYVIGDAKEPRRIKDAIEEGFATALRI